MRVLPILFGLGVILAGERHGMAAEKEMPRLTMAQVRASAERIDAAILKLGKDHESTGAPKVHVPPLASDDVFLRRLMVDMVGRLPTVGEVHEFAQGKDAEKREHWANKVATSDEAATWRFRRIADVLRVRDEANGTSLRPYIEWLRERVEEDMPYDALAKRLMEAQGSVDEDPAAGFLLTDSRELRATAGETMRALLGMDIQCSACHDAPFEDMSQRQFQAFAGAFNRVVEDERGGLRLAAEPTPCRLPKGYQYRDGTPGEVVPIAGYYVPHLGLGMKAKSVEWKPAEARMALSDWMVGEENVRFQEVAVVRVWEWMFGRMRKLYLDSNRLFASEAPE